MIQLSKLLSTKNLPKRNLSDFLVIMSDNIFYMCQKVAPCVTAEIIRGCQGNKINYGRFSILSYMPSVYHRGEYTELPDK